MASLKVKVTVQTYAMSIGYNENMFVSYSCLRYDCKINVSLFDLHGPSVVFTIVPCLLCFFYLAVFTATVAKGESFQRQRTKLPGQ